MFIKAAVLRETASGVPYDLTRPMEIADVELAPPGPGEVLVAIKAAGLCHSDLSVVNGDRPRPLPMVLGHEAAGVVEAVGDGVSDLVPAIACPVPRAAPRCASRARWPMAAAC